MTAKANLAEPEEASQYTLYTIISLLQEPPGGLWTVRPMKERNLSYGEIHSAQRKARVTTAQLSVLSALSDSIMGNEMFIFVLRILNNRLACTQKVKKHTLIVS